ncbi:cupin domain-containing protein [Pararhizobium sp. YC-54]|uniref:cupin domain-containing protein n=1 Tax=Pararhizobium sp. YC-54 TaxID=2986920 RepID=UPI0021F73872|nr:cupin domain-containing protein [Pararhizobium sp. YC-54]MCW0001531.1 cupin domain-containing protein [Pararhizobium sp. YC-54]
MSGSDQQNEGFSPPNFRHVSDMEWEMGRFKNKTKFLFHPTKEDPTAPNAGILVYEPGAGFPLHRHQFAQIWYILEGEFRCGTQTYGPGTFAFMPDPHFEHEMHTETGGKIVFVQYPGPSTGARPMYDGRMNLKQAERPQDHNLDL